MAACPVRALQSPPCPSRTHVTEALQLEYHQQSSNEEGFCVADTMTNIVLLSDGTGNSAAKVWRTNVWRMFEALDVSSSEQMAFYDDGVGTSSFKPLAVIGGAFGWGLKRNVIGLYKAVCRNYRSQDDQI